MSSYVVEVLDSLSKSTEATGYNLCTIRGIPQNPTFQPALYESLIDSFVAQDGDVFIVTYVKAGTTWTQQICHLLLRDGEAGGFYGESIPWLEAVTSELLNPREAPTWTLEKIQNNPGPRYFKSHANVEHLPGYNAVYNNVKSGSNDSKVKKNVKIIYVARNPKDTVVSLFHHAKSKPEFGYTGSFDKFCEIFLAGKEEIKTVVTSIFFVVSLIPR